MPWSIDAAWNACPKRHCICCERVFDELRVLPGSKFEWDIQALPRELKTSIIEKRVQLSG